MITAKYSVSLLRRLDFILFSLLSPFMIVLVVGAAQLSLNNEDSRAWIIGNRVWTLSLWIVFVSAYFIILYVRRDPFVKKAFNPTEELGNFLYGYDLKSSKTVEVAVEVCVKGMIYEDDDSYLLIVIRKEQENLSGQAYFYYQNINPQAKLESFMSESVQRVRTQFAATEQAKTLLVGMTESKWSQADRTGHVDSSGLRG